MKTKVAFAGGFGGGGGPVGRTAGRRFGLRRWAAGPGPTEPLPPPQRGAQTASTGPA